MASTNREVQSEKSAITALLLCLFLGSLGIHRFYVGKIKTGILMLLTGGGLGIWTLIDIILIASCNFKDKKGQYLIFTRGRASSLKLIFIVLGCIIAAIIIYVSLLVALVFYFTSSMTTVIQDQLSALRSGDMNKAYFYLSSETKTTVSINDFKRYVERYPIMTTNISASFSERQRENDEGYVRGTLKTREGTKIIIEYRLVKEGDGWKILALRLDTSTGSGTESEDTPYKLFESKEYKYLIKYPSYWTYEKPNEASVIFIGKKGSTNASSTVSIQVAPSKAAGGKYQHVKAAIDDLKRQISTEAIDVHFIDAGEMQLPLNPKKFYGEYFIVTYTYKGHALKKMQFVLSNDSGSILYSWDYTSPIKQYEHNLPIAKKMFESWLIE